MIYKPPASVYLDLDTLLTDTPITHMLQITRYRLRSPNCLSRKVTFTHLAEVPRQLQGPYQYNSSVLIITKPSTAPSTVLLCVLSRTY